MNNIMGENLVPNHNITENHFIFKRKLNNKRDMLFHAGLRACWKGTDELID